MEGPDAKLARRCLKGDVRAWENIVESYSGRILNMAYRYTGSFAVAEELTQDIFLKVYQNLSSFHSGSGSLRNWIMRVGRNHIIDYYRAHKKEKSVAGSEELEILNFEVDSGLPNPFENLYLKEKAQFLHQGMAKLAPELKEAVLLRDIEGFSYLEIADLLGIPEGTVKSRINRGRIELARILGAAR